MTTASTKSQRATSTVRFVASESANHTSQDNERVISKPAASSRAIGRSDAFNRKGTAMSDELDNYGILGTIYFLDGIPRDPSPDVQHDIDTLCGVPDSSQADADSERVGNNA